MKNDPLLKNRAAGVLQRLEQRYPKPRPTLDWDNPWQLLVATVLAAQCTDARVNLVTPFFFQRWPSPAELSKAATGDIEEIIRSTGFYHNKAKHLREAARIIMTSFNGAVPQSMSELLTLPGVARKTANIVLSHAFNRHEGIAVDTHVKRIAGRLGLTDSTDPMRIEKDLMPLFERRCWGLINHMLVMFGREICHARKPLCQNCPLGDLCPRIDL